MIFCLIGNGVNPIIVFVIFSVVTAIIVIEVKKDMDLKKIYNFSREVKSLKMKSKLPKLDANNCTLIGTTQNRKPVFVENDVKHVFICGTTGSGKTVALSNFINSAIENNYGLVIIDGKGDTNTGSILDITSKLAKGRKKLYTINLNDPQNSDKYNPFQNTNPTVAKDMLINMSEWSEEHYKLNTERYLQRVIGLLSKFGVKLCFSSIIKCMSKDKFIAGSMELLKKDIITKPEHVSNLELAESSGTISAGAVARFSNIVESDLGVIFGREGIDIFQAIEENAIILFVLNPLLYPEISPAIGKLALIDARKAVSKLFNKQGRRFFIFDEISTYANNSLLDLVNKSRSAGVTNILATQSLSDLDTVSEQYKEQIIENCNNYIVLRQNSATNAEQWANILGTRSSMEVTYQLQQQHMSTQSTGFGSARRVKEYLYHPDEIKNLATGKGIFLSKDSNYHTRVLINKPF